MTVVPPASAPRQSGRRATRTVGWILVWVIGVLAVPFAVTYLLSVLAAHDGYADGPTTFTGTAAVSSCHRDGRYLDAVFRCDARVDTAGRTPGELSPLQASHLIAPHAVSGTIPVQQHCGSTSRTGVLAGCFLYDARQIRDVGWAWVIPFPLVVSLVVAILVWYTRRARRNTRTPGSPGAAAAGPSATEAYAERYQVTLPPSARSDTDPTTGRPPGPPPEYDGGTTR